MKPRISVSRGLAGAPLDRGARGAQQRPQGRAVERGGLDTTWQPEKDHVWRASPGARPSEALKSNASWADRTERRAAMYVVA